MVGKAGSGEERRKLADVWIRGGPEKHEDSSGGGGEVIEVGLAAVVQAGVRVRGGEIDLHHPIPADLFKVCLSYGHKISE
jgi:hypothetical protein